MSRGLNDGYIAELLERYLDSPASIPPAWRELFERMSADEALAVLPGSRVVTGGASDPRDAVTSSRPAPSIPAGNGQPFPAAGHTPTPTPSHTAVAPGGSAPDPSLLAAVAAATALVQAYRTHGHLAARLDPLGSEPEGEPALDETTSDPPLTPELQGSIPASVLGVHLTGRTLADVLPRLREVYAGTIAYEIEHIADHAERAWLRQAIESERFRLPLDAEAKRDLLERLTRVEGFEQYLRRAFLGQKQFSIEGLDVLVPVLDHVVASAAATGAADVVLGMAHRGRLNVLVHVIGRPYETVLREFEGEKSYDALVLDPEGGTGDVKYHLGASRRVTTRNGDIAVRLVPNPSHLEAVDPVVEGLARAGQTDRSSGAGRHEPGVVVPVLIHGDASFAGQGVVAETLNLQTLEGYSTGGTIHLIANNQIGFTTDTWESRSTRYSSDLAKGFDVPIIHVNADDPEAALQATALALAYRQRFGGDVVIDLVGYRRFGHNEQDEASYTQPLMAAAIASHPTVRETYAASLVAQGVVDQAHVDELRSEVTSDLRAAHERLKESFARPNGDQAAASGSSTTSTAGVSDVDTSVSAERLDQLNERLLEVPDGFAVNEKLHGQLERRRSALRESGIDWGHAEALAYASLLEDGVAVRLSGQDTQRGTFAHRHLVLHDARTGDTYAPIQHLTSGRASLEVINSPLSEYAAVGFEYGYSVAAPGALVLWEAQFGDFVNGAQIIVDQFITAGRSKWGQLSRLTLLLPHGYEGNGPEHSSARLERFLQLSAQENVRIASPSTAAQLFHLLRRQALDPVARPLVVMTPKGLLRLRNASSSLVDLTSGSFARVLDDTTVDHSRVERLVLCSGKIYYDIVGHAHRDAASTTAVARLEQLYPFPVEPLAQVVKGYPALRVIDWVQEEPQNMGPWRSIRQRLEEAAASVSLDVGFVGRPMRASPSEGYPTAHQREQDRIVRRALAPAG